MLENLVVVEMLPPHNILPPLPHPNNRTTKNPANLKKKKKKKIPCHGHCMPDFVLPWA